jgi:hypothetical protein
VRDPWLIFGIAVAILCLLEAGLSLAFVVYDRWTWRPADTRFQADTYDNAAWPVDYYKEHSSTRMNWSPYVYWRRAPYRGRLVNVDDHGLRVTVPTTSAPSALKIFMFGGSTMWGTGARDEFTIPSLVARDLERSGVVAAVLNFGESGYVSTQQRIALELELMRGKRPDLVIFYDGINDTYSAFQQGVVGLPQNENNRVREFNLTASEMRGERIRGALSDVVKGLSITRFIDYFRSNRYAPSSAHYVGSGVSSSGSPAPEELARRTLQVYASNLELVRTLSRQYDFDFLAYWQPTILDKPHLTPYETSCLPELEAMQPFFRLTYDLLRRSDLDETHQVRDISRIFADTRIPIFVDFLHPGEMGNEMIARRIAADVREEIADRQTPGDRRLRQRGLPESE